MKKIVLFILSSFGFALYSYAQMAFVDTKYILNRMPDYQDSVKKNKPDECNLAKRN